LKDIFCHRYSCAWLRLAVYGHTGRIQDRVKVCGRFKEKRHKSKRRLLETRHFCWTGPNIATFRREDHLYSSSTYKPNIHLGME